MSTVDCESLLETAVRRARADGRTALFEHEAYGFLPLLGLAAPRHLFVEADADPGTASEKICGGLHGDRVVLKIVAPGVLHKTELGGVVFVERSMAPVRAAIESLRARFSATAVAGILAAEIVPFDGALGSELLLGIRWTEDFGPIVTFGIGGVLTEALDRALRPGLGAAIFSPGLTPEADIERILQEKFITPIVTGAARGQKSRLEIAALRALIGKAFSFAAAWVPDPIAELEINPFVASNGRAVALDALVKLTGSPAVALPADRPLPKIERLLRPRSIAVTGVSRSVNPGRVIVKNLLAAGFDPSAITIVKSGDDTIDGCRCVPDLAAAGIAVDLLVLAISSDQIPDAVDAAIAHRAAESILVIPGGLGEREGSESLEARVRSSIEASRATEWRGPVVNGGNCLGIISRPGKVDTIFLPAAKLRGGEPQREAPLAIVSQSGAFAAARITALGALAPEYVISIGNQIDLTSGDYLAYLAADPGVRVFAFYVEGFRALDGRRWLAAARRVTGSGRPVILYRAGRTPEGSKASASHTAAIAGDAAVARELATAAGVVVAESLEEFDDLTRLFTLLTGRRISGRRLAAMSNAGFETVAFADNLSGFELAELSASTRRAVAEIVREQRLDRVVSIANPLDVNPMMGDAAFARACAALLEDDGVDAAIVGCVPLTPALSTLPPGAGHQEDLGSPHSVAGRLGALWERSTKPWVAVVDSGALYDPMAAALDRAGIPLFRTADRALRAFSRWAEWMLGRGGAR
jgi:acyl-CoA synthetase (NDP forming)